MTSTAQGKGSEILISPTILHTGFTATHIFILHVPLWQLKYFSYNLTLLHVMKAFGNWRLNLQRYISQHPHSLNCVIYIHNFSHLREEYKRKLYILHMHDY